MTPREIVIAQIDHQETPTIPYTLGFEGGTDKLLDEYFGSEDWRGRIVNAIEGVGFQATTLRHPVEGQEGIYDTDAFGTMWRVDRPPFHLETPGMPEPDFDKHPFPSHEPFLAQAAEAKAEAFKTLEENPPDSYRTIYMGWGLFEQLWGIRGFNNAMMDVAINEEFVEELLDKLMDLYVECIEFWADLPADAILFGDDWGEQRGVIVGAERWRKLFKPRYAKIYEATHASGKKVMSHCCGSVADIMDDIIEIGMDVLESVQPEAAGMNPYELKKRYGKNIAYWGCLGSQSTIPFGTPDEIKAEVAKLSKEMGVGGGFILAPAKSLQPGTPVENCVATFEAFTALNPV